MPESIRSSVVSAPAELSGHQQYGMPGGSVLGVVNGEGLRGSASASGEILIANLYDYEPHLLLITKAVNIDLDQEASAANLIGWPREQPVFLRGYFG